MGRPRSIFAGGVLLAAFCFSACAASHPRAISSSRGVPSLRERVDRRFEWPIDGGSVSSGFGIRHGVMHDGIDIAAPAGTPVHAADNGAVIFSGRLRGYGNVIIIRHDTDYATVYGHNLANYVREGDRVRRGQVIAKVGNTGHASGCNLHFEVRCDNLARNPLNYLPVEPAAIGPSFARRGPS